MKSIILISSITENSHGGVKSLAMLFLKTYHENIVRLNPITSKIQFIKSFFKDTNYIVIGYADTAVYLSIPIFIFFRKRIIYIPCYHPFYTMRRKLLARIYEKTIFKIFLNAKVVICLSKMEVSLLERLNAKGNYIYLPMPSPLKHLILSEEKNLIKNKIIFVGRDDSNKNLSEFIRIAIKLRNAIQSDYEFLVVSDTKRTFPDWITHTKKLSDAELTKIYLSTAAIIIPSKWESLSLVGIEVIQYGGKVICNQNVMLSNLMERFDTLILDKYDDIDAVLDFLEKSINPDQIRQFNYYFSEKNFIQNFKCITDILNKSS